MVHLKQYSCGNCQKQIGREKEFKKDQKDSSEKMFQKQ